MVLNLTKKRVLFIVNPIAGISKKIRIPELIGAHIDTGLYDYRIAYTQFAGHAVFLAQEAVADGFDMVVAVGGDGSVNEVGSQLVNTSVALGIIPLGSGNGLATKLKIPLQQIEAIKLLNKGQISAIDVGLINQRCFFSCAGIGYSANVAARFAGRRNRGVVGYALTIASGLPAYHPTNCRLVCNDTTYSPSAFDITFNNSGQFGYGLGLTPSSKLNDGLLELTVVRTFPLYLILWVVFLFLIGRLHKSRLFQAIETNHAFIKCPHAVQAQIDGDPAMIDQNFEITVQKQALQVMMP
ncbi:MAG: diacylglycerol kinase family lipid kinase [Sphingobacteriales bacterium]|nr:MAG: diacylglycerol kinase family lipid kinase [Sphingobacteriales bacterium]